MLFKHETLASNAIAARPVFGKRFELKSAYMRRHLFKVAGIRLEYRHFVWSQCRILAMADRPWHRTLVGLPGPCLPNRVRAAGKQSEARSRPALAEPGLRSMQDKGIRLRNTTALVEDAL